MAHGMRILWFGDLAATGFGTVTADTGREMLKLGHDVRFVSQNEVPDLEEPFVSRTLNMTTYVYGAGGIEGVMDSIPNLLAGNAADHTLMNGEGWGAWKPEAVFMLGDFYGFREFVERAGVDAFKNANAHHYVPVEGHDLPPSWIPYWKVIPPIAMTKFGQDQIELLMGERPPLVYHGVDSDTFHPISPTSPITVTETDKDGRQRKLVLTSKTACKAFLTGNPSITFVLRTDRNMPRKGYPALIRAMAPVMRERPNVVLGLHCRRWDQGGLLDDSVSKYPDIADRVFIPDLGSVPREVLAIMYNAADIYVSTSAEGFGLTIAEAIACGVPAVGLDYSAVPEVIGPAGAVVPVGRYLDNEYAHHWALPDEDAFGKAVAYLIDHPHKRLELGKWGPGHVRKNFRWDIAAQRFAQIAQNHLRGTVEPRSAPIPQPDVSDSLQLVAA